MPSKKNILRICKKCGNQFYTYKFQIDKGFGDYCSKSCVHKKTGKYLERGYYMVSVNNVQIPEHRFIMEQFLGRKLSKDEIVHHKNHDKLDNRIENLEITTRAKHAAHHSVSKNIWSRNYPQCIECGRTNVLHNAKGLCQACYSRNRKQNLNQSFSE